MFKITVILNIYWAQTSADKQDHLLTDFYTVKPEESPPAVIVRYFLLCCIPGPWKPYNLAASVCLKVVSFQSNTEMFWT